MQYSFVLPVILLAATCGSAKRIMAPHRNISRLIHVKAVPHSKRIASSEQQDVSKSPLGYMPGEILFSKFELTSHLGNSVFGRAAWPPFGSMVNRTSQENISVDMSVDTSLLEDAVSPSPLKAAKWLATKVKKRIPSRKKVLGELDFLAGKLKDLASKAKHVLHGIAEEVHREAPEKKLFTAYNQYKKSGAKEKVPYPKGFMKLEGISTGQHMGSGSFGEAWLAKGLPGSRYAGMKFIVKLLYTTHNGRNVHVTPNLLRRKEHRDLLEDIEGAEEECQVARRLIWPTGPMKTNRIYAGRFANCHYTNVKTAEEDDPIFLVLQECGGQDLASYILSNLKKLDSKTIASILKQIAEALYYLDHLAVPMIHHDLKPANIVVKEEDAMTPLEEEWRMVSRDGPALEDWTPPIIHLIDFGGMIEATKQNMRASSVATLSYAPEEWMDGYAFKIPSYSFDMFSLGNIISDLMIGIPMTTIVSVMTEPDGSDGSLDDFEKLDRLHDNRKGNWEKWQENIEMFVKGTGASGWEAVVNDPLGRDFLFKVWRRMFSSNPKERPTPGELLKHPWIVAAETPEQVSWF